MSAALVIALIALAGSIFSTVATAFWSPWLQSRREARTTLDTYREPLLAAAYELQARLHNVIAGTFVADYLRDSSAEKQEAAILTTLYVFAQYFGWREIIRREVQLLRFDSDAETRETARLLSDICETFLTSELDPAFMIWRVEQRGFGEQMIALKNGRPECLGYASFIEQQPKMDRWLMPLQRDLQGLGPGGHPRLRELQHQLLKLVRHLDKDNTRYPDELKPA